MVEFKGKINNIIFENNEDLFKIMDVEIIGKLDEYSDDHIVVTGNFGNIQLETTYQFSGRLVMHNKFGLQFRADSYKQVMPHEEGSLTKYLSSNKFPGIGKQAAKKIVDEVGLNALDELKNNPARIAALPLTQKQKDSLLRGINTMDSFSEIVLKLAQYGIKKNIATQIYQLYHGESLEKIQENPYASIDEVSGYGFKSADTIGKELGITGQDPKRIQGAIYEVLLDALNGRGDTYVDLAELLTETSKLLETNQFDPIAEVINDLQVKNKLVVDNENAYLANIFKCENDIAQDMLNLVNRKKTQKSETYSDEDVEDAIKDVEKELEIKYDATQKTAIKNALNNPISILTGGPGTGKTTIINGILMALRKLADIPSSALFSEDPPFLLAAPTGRAAKRMGEITGIAAKTIHRLLGIGIGDSDNEELNKLNGEILIIDEMSMVDMFLFKQLISSIDQTRHIVFVGDRDQLPSVGEGNVFSDLIKSGAFPTTILKQIHRQGDDSTIISLAHDINEGKNQDALFKKTKNYSFIPCHPQQIGEAVRQIIELALKRGFDKDQIQVLAAMYKGPGGINNLNDILQEIMNPSKERAKKIEAHDEVFRIDDRVLQLQNNPEKDIYNGQIGKVIGIDEEDSSKCLIADFDGREIEFSKKELYDLTRAYAITIHKSQGSEFPLVILNLTMQNFMMLKRNLLYTAITRAEKNLVLVGEPKAYIMAFNTPGNDRKTGLTAKLKKILGIIEPEKTQTKKEISSLISEENNEIQEDDEEDYLLTKEKIYSGVIDPMIGMEGISLTKQ